MHPANGTYFIGDRDITSKEASLLTKERLIQLHWDGWTLTRKGGELLSLLIAYGDPKHDGYNASDLKSRATSCLSTAD